MVVVHGCYTAVRSWRSETLVGRPLGVRAPFGPKASVVVWGSAVAPPMTLLVGLVVAAARRRRDWLARLGGVLVLGQLSEPVLYVRTLAPEDRWARRSAVGNLVAGAVIAAAGYRGSAGSTGGR